MHLSFFTLTNIQHINYERSELANSRLVVKKYARLKLMWRIYARECVPYRIMNQAVIWGT